MPSHPPSLRCPALLLACTLLAACGDKPAHLEVPGGDAEQGKLAVQRFGCVACHHIPGVPGYGANVGPPLAGMSQRAYIAGVIANTPANMVRWLQHPPAIDPLTAMPDLGVSEREARDIAAYLYAGT